jgi:TetR/AcrR family transcriptional regulator
MPPARIARRAGVNKQLIFYYFGSKVDLYRDTLRGAAAAVGDAPNAPAARVAQTGQYLLEAVQSMFDTLTRHADLRRLLLRDASEVGATTSLAATVVAKLTADLERVISEGQGLGFFRDDASPAMVARQALVLSLGYFALEPAFGSPDASHRIEWRGAMTELLKRGLAW